MTEISKQALSEVELLKEIYKKLAGENPALDLNKALSKAALLRGIAEVAKPIPAPYVPEGPTIMADIPTTLLPGQKVWCVATQSEWIGADPDNGIFPTLSEGEAWPVVGYKTLDGIIKQKQTTNPDFNILKSDFGVVSATFVSLGSVNIAIEGLTIDSLCFITPAGQEDQTLSSSVKIDSYQAGILILIETLCLSNIDLESTPYYYNKPIYVKVITYP
jgi:hypothetical protein